MREACAIISIVGTDLRIVESFLAGEFHLREFDGGVGLGELGGERGEFARARAFAQIGEARFGGVEALGGFEAACAFGGIFE